MPQTTAGPGRGLKLEARMKRLLLTLALALLAGAALAEEGSYDEGYNAGRENPNDSVPYDASSEYADGFQRGADDTASEERARQAEQEAQAREEAEQAQREAEQAAGGSSGE